MFGCQYPLWSGVESDMRDDEFLFCDKETVEDTSWCEEHLKIVTKSEEFEEEHIERPKISTLIGMPSLNFRSRQKGGGRKVKRISFDDIIKDSISMLKESNKPIHMNDFVKHFGEDSRYIGQAYKNSNLKHFYNGWWALQEWPFRDFVDVDKIETILPNMSVPRAVVAILYMEKGWTSKEYIIDKIFDIDLETLRNSNSMKARNLNIYKRGRIVSAIRTLHGKNQIINKQDMYILPRYYESLSNES